MGLGKWIGGIVGFMSMGPLGALAGYALGSLFDNATSKQDNQQDINDNQQAYNNAYSGQRNSFLVFSVGFGIIHHPCRRKDYAQRNGVRASLSQK